MSKRTRSEADEPQSQINRSCQYKRTKEEPSPPLPIAPLHISVLRWDGEPIAWDADGNDTEEYAQYVYAIPPSSPLSAVAWSDEHAAWRYHPPPGNDIRFIYKRAMFIGTGNAALTWYGKIWGEADEQDPLFFVHHSRNTNVFHASKEYNHGGPPEVIEGPPFTMETMYTLNITPSAPTPADIIPLSMPDLEQHRAALEESVDAESSDNEEHPGLRHGLDYTGWSGNWTRTFIERARSGKTLIPLEKIIWDKKNTWGIKVKLEPMRKSVNVERIMFDDDTDEDEDDETKIRTYTGLRKPRLESYQVRATVIDVFIRPAFFQELDLEGGASGAQATSVNDSVTAS